MRRHFIMKKAIMCFIGAMMILSLVACTPTTEKNKTGEVKQTQASSAAAGTAAGTSGGNSVASNKNPDPTAPDLDVVSIYTVSKDGSKLEGTMDAVEELTPQALADLLIQYGVLEEGTEVIDFQAEGKPASEEVGPRCDQDSGCGDREQLKGIRHFEFKQAAGRRQGRYDRQGCCQHLPGEYGCAVYYHSGGR